MKRCGGFFFAAATVAVLLLGSLSAGGVSLCAYRSPISSVTVAGMTFSYRYYDDAATPVVDVNSGRIGIDFDQVFDSPDFGYSVGVTGSLNMEQFVPVDWLGHGSGTARWYLWEDGLLFTFGGVEMSMATSQPRPGLEARAGLGWGRFTDVTPLAKAMDIESALLDQGAILGPLSDDALLSIATTIDRIDEFDETKDLVTDVESLIEAVAGVELDARALLTIREIVLRKGDSRKCGWAVQAGIGYELIDPYAGAQNVVLVASADAAYTKRPEHQVLFDLSFSGPFDLLNENTLTATLSYEVEMSTGSTLALDYTVQRVKPAGLAVTVSHAVSASIGLNAGGIDVGLDVMLSRGGSDPGWSVDVSLSASIDLL